MNGVDPSDFDEPEPVDPNVPEPVPPMLAGLADLFVQSSASKEGASREKQAEAALNRAIKHGWLFMDVPGMVKAACNEETWSSALRRYILMPFQTGKQLVPVWVAAVATAMVKHHLYEVSPGKGGQTVQEARLRVGKVRTAFLEMVLSWVAGAGPGAPERAEAVASVIMLSKNKMDAETRVQHLINESW